VGRIQDILLHQRKESSDLRVGKKGVYLLQERDEQAVVVSPTWSVGVSSGDTVEHDPVGGGVKLKVKVIICPVCGYEHVDRNMCIVCGCGWRSCA